MNTANVLFSFLCTLALVAGATYDLTVKKMLNNGDAIPSDTESTFSFSDDSPDVIVVTFKVGTARWKSITSTSVYFANDAKNITKIEFTDKKVTETKYETPYKSVHESVEDLSEANPVDFTYSVKKEDIPQDTSSVSASVSIVDAKNKTVILNYYGIKNYAISISDTLIVENFMRANLSNE